MVWFKLTEFKLLGVVLAAPIVLAGCRAKSPADSYDSPEAVYQAMYDAVQAKDWEKMVGCLTPESREVMAGMMVMTGAFMTMDEEQGPTVKELFKKHGMEGLDEEPVFGEVTEPLSVDVRLSYEAPFFMTYETVDLPEPQAAPLYATLVLDGKPIAEASQVGFLQVGAARDDKGKDVVLLKAEAEDLDVGGDFVCATGGVLMKEATRPLEIDLMLEGPSAEATLLAALQGSLKLLTGGRTEDVVINNVRGIEQQTAIENEALQTAGVTLELPYGVSEDTVYVAAQGPIWSIDVVDGKGDTIDTTCVSRCPLSSKASRCRARAKERRMREVRLRVGRSRA